MVIVQCAKLQTLARCSAENGPGPYECLPLQLYHCAHLQRERKPRSQEFNVGDVVAAAAAVTLALRIVDIL